MATCFRVPHYEQRLRSLHYKKRFLITLNEISPRITSVMEASREVARSRRLRRLLEIVLALGNYMNRGARGNASGFRLASLNRLGDTKSSAAKGTTLLHYLVQILEKKVNCYSYCPLFSMLTTFFCSLRTSSDLMKTFLMCEKRLKYRWES